MPRLMFRTENSRQVTSLGYSPNGKRLAANTEHDFALLDARNGKATMGRRKVLCRRRKRPREVQPPRPAWRSADARIFRRRDGWSPAVSSTGTSRLFDVRNRTPRAVAFATAWSLWKDGPSAAPGR